LIKAMAAAFGKSFYKPASHKYGNKTMCWGGNACDVLRSSIQLVVEASNAGLCVDSSVQQSVD
jgi:hypothetical protein